MKFLLAGINVTCAFLLGHCPVDIFRRSHQRGIAAEVLINLFFPEIEHSLVNSNMWLWIHTLTVLCTILSYNQLTQRIHFAGFIIIIIWNWVSEREIWNVKELLDSSLELNFHEDSLAVTNTIYFWLPIPPVASCDWQKCMNPDMVVGFNSASIPYVCCQFRSTNIIFGRTPISSKDTHVKFLHLWSLIWHQPPFREVMPQICHDCWPGLVCCVCRARSFLRTTS